MRRRVGKHGSDPSVIQEYEWRSSSAGRVGPACFHKCVALNSASQRLFGPFDERKGRSVSGYKA